MHGWSPVSTCVRTCEPTRWPYLTWTVCFCGASASAAGTGRLFRTSPAWTCTAGWFSAGSPPRPGRCSCRMPSWMSRGAESKGGNLPFTEGIYSPNTHFTADTTKGIFIWHDLLPLLLLSLSIKSRFPINPISHFTASGSAGQAEHLFLCSSRDVPVNQTASVFETDCAVMTNRNNNNNNKKRRSKTWLPSLSVLSHIHQMSCLAYVTQSHTRSDDSVYDASKQNLLRFGNVLCFLCVISPWQKIGGNQNSEQHLEIQCEEFLMKAKY